MKCFYFPKFVYFPRFVTKYDEIFQSSGISPQSGSPIDGSDEWGEAKIKMFITKTFKPCEVLMSDLSIKTKQNFIYVCMSFMQLIPVFSISLYVTTHLQALMPPSLSIIVTVIAGIPPYTCSCLHH